MSKLVRDGIPDGDPTMNVYSAPESTRTEWLICKLQEEAEELWQVENRGELLEELGDVWEVFEALISSLDISMAEVIAAAQKKRAAKGAFEKLLIWDGQ